MPAIIRMSLSNGNPTQAQIKALTYSASIASISKTPQNIPLSSGGMIQRIHTVKPGCGSCGKK